jgi:hypothetical protein
MLTALYVPAGHENLLLRVSSWTAFQSALQNTMRGEIRGDQLFEIVNLSIDRLQQIQLTAGCQLLAARV